MPTGLSSYHYFAGDNPTNACFHGSDLSVPASSKEETHGHPDQFNVSGRPGSMGLTSVLLSELGDGKRKIFNYGFISALRNIGLEQLATIIEKGSGSILLPLGAKAKINFSEKTFEFNDKYILQDDIRSACSQVFEKNGQEVKWVEIKSTIELEEQANQKLEFKSHTIATGEGKLSNLIRYRRLELYESPCGMIEKGTTLYNALQMPITASLAVQMPVGSEFEVVAEAHALLKPELASCINLYQTSATTTSLDGSLALSNDIAGDISILVQKLPKPNHVLVKIVKADGFSSLAKASVCIKTQTKPNFFVNMRSFLSQFIDQTLNQLGLLDWIKSIFDYQLSAQLADVAKESHHHIKRYVFDLSNPHAQMAYNEIFSQISTQKADALVAQKEKGVKFQGGGDTVISHAHSGDATVGTTKIWSHYGLQNEREEKLVTSSEDALSFREFQFSQKYFDWFSGEKTVQWETVALKDDVRAESKSYYHLLFKKNDRIAEQREMDEFLRFCRALGIDIDDPKFRKYVNIEKLAQIFVNRDDALTSVDIYFTDNGIHKIREASLEQLVAAYLTSKIQMSSITKKFSFLSKNKDGTFALREGDASYQLVEKYSIFKKKWFLSRWWHRGEMKQLANQYLLLTQQNIEEDADAFLEALQFAQKIVALKNQDIKNKEEKLFATLGSLMGFDYMKTIIALAGIAGEDETIIHGLSMSAGGVSLCGMDEGEIVHPQREVTRTLASLA